MAVVRRSIMFRSESARRSRRYQALKLSLLGLSLPWLVLPWHKLANSVLAGRGGKLQPCFRGVYLNGPKGSIEVGHPQATHLGNGAQLEKPTRETPPPSGWDKHWTSRSSRQVTHLHLHVRSAGLSRRAQRAPRDVDVESSWDLAAGCQAAAAHPGRFPAAGSCVMALPKSWCVGAVDANPRNRRRKAKRPALR